MSVHLGLCSCECVALCIFTSKFLEEIERDSHGREEGVTNMRSRATVKEPFRFTLQTISAQGSCTYMLAWGSPTHIFQCRSSSDPWCRKQMLSIRTSFAPLKNNFVILISSFIVTTNQPARRFVALSSSPLPSPPKQQQNSG